MGPDVFGLDKAIFEWVYQLPLPTMPLEWITHTTTGGGIWILAAIGLLIRGGLDRRAGAAVASGLLLHLAIVEFGIKPLVARVRPFTQMGVEIRDSFMNPESYSFPSGHTEVSFMAAFVITARYPKAQIPLFALASLVAFSRVHLGAHYPTDVFAGAALGMFIGVGMVLAFKVMSNEEAEERKPKSAKAAATEG